MAISYFVEVAGDREASGDWKTPSLALSRQFEIIADVTNTETDILTYGSVPTYGAAHPTSPYSYLVSREAKEQGEPGHWIVTCKYQWPDIPTPSQKGISQPAGPNSGGGTHELGEVKSVNFSTKEVKEYPEEDLLAAPYVNSAKEIFKPPHEVPTEYLVIKLTYYVSVSSFSLVDLNWWMNSINTNAITLFGKTFAAKTLLVRKPRADFIKSDNAYVYKVEMEIEHNPEGWNPKILDKGFNQSDGAGGIKRIVDLQNRPYTNESLLDGTGLKLAPGLAPVTLPFVDFVDVDLKPLFKNLPG